ncbi:MAG: dTDP-4-dehydrorhamnose reductase, partial [Blastocatellia bacterium]
MKILVTGANGMVAGSVIRQSLAAGDEVIGLARESLDISNRDNVFDAIVKHRPDALINCAAFTDVDGAESNPEAAFAVNEQGVRNLAAAAGAIGCVFATISTDYVFDGRKSGFYTQRDLPAPLGVYGKSKRAGEIAAFAENPASIIVRSGWIFGPGGRNFLSRVPDFYLNGTSFTAISDSFGTPTYSEDLGNRLRELAAAALPGLYHITNTGPGTSYFGFADWVRKQMKVDAAAPEPIASVSLNRPAPRPENSRLACLISERLGFAPMPDWKDAIRRFL